MKIYKYRVQPGEWKRLTARKVIHFGPDPSGALCVWGETDPEVIVSETEVVVIGTGWDVPEEGGIEHAGSCLDGDFVWHLYSRTL